MTDVLAATAARLTAGVIADWVAGRAVALTMIDPEAPLTDLEPLRAMVGDAVIVGVGGSTYGAHEQFALTHRITRYLVKELGFRAVATEQDRAVALDLDEYIRTGNGDLAALASRSAVPWRTAETRASLTWLREWNAGHPGDEVRFFGAGVTDYGDEQMALNLRWWHEHTGHKIVYWSTIAHSASAPRLTIAIPPRDPLEFTPTGTHLRQRYGNRYVSVGITYNEGTVNSCWALPPFSGRPVATAAQPAGFAEHPLVRVGLPQFALDLRVDDPPASMPPGVREWLHGPARTRIIGSVYDPRRPADQFYMTGGSLAEWFDVLIHQDTVTPSHPL